MGNFEELTEGDHYDLVGWTTTHHRNHYGTSTLIKKLRALADSLYKDSSYVIQINDMSLIYGGPFDCNEKYLWDTPHETHRQGVNADISYKATGGKRIPEKIFKWYVVKQLNGKYDPHGEYHTTF